MKQLVTNFKPIFDPTTKQLDFSTYPGFSLGKLYAVINITANVPIYIAGAPGLGITTLNGPDNLLTLQYDTTAQNSTDDLNVYYDTDAGYESNLAQENYGNLEKMRLLMRATLVELKVLNHQISALNSGRIDAKTATDIDDIRRSVSDPSEWEDMGNTN